MHIAEQHPLSLRLHKSTAARLGSRAQRAQTRPSTLAKRYVEEGLRMDEHPLIRFVDGPAGRRPALIGGPDVWEAIGVIRDNGNDLAAAAEYLRKPVGLLQAAVSYYGAYPDEIDEWIEGNRREAEAAQAAWAAGHAALGS